MSFIGVYEKSFKMTARKGKQAKRKVFCRNTIPLTDQAIQGIMWTGFRTILIYALRTITLMVLARLLSPEDFGIMTAATAVVGFLSGLQDLGIGQALVQYSALEVVHIRAGFTFSLVVGAGLTLGVWGVAPIIARFFPFEGMATILRVLAFSFLLTDTSVVARALLQREMRFRALAGLEALSYAVGYVAVAIPLAIFGFKVWALVGAYLAEVFVSGMGALLLRPHDFRPLLDGCAIKELLKFGGGYTITRIANYASTQADKVVVGRWLGAYQLGIYSRAYYFVATASTFVESTFGRVLFPVMTQLQHEQERLASTYLHALSLINLMLCPIVIISIVIAPELINVLLGKQWVETVFPFRLLAPGIWFVTLYEVSFCLIKAKGAVYPLGKMQILYFGLVIVGALLGQRWGVNAVAVGVMIAMAVNALMIIVLSLQLVQMAWRDICSAFVPALISGGILGLWGWLISETLRSFNFPSIAVILVVGLGSPIIWFLFWRLSPTFFFGSTGTEAIRMVLSKVSPRVQAVLRFFLGAKSR